MIYLTKDELHRLFTEASVNRTHHMLLLSAFWFGARISELLSLRGDDITDGQLSLYRLKQGKTKDGRKRGPKLTVQAIHRDSDPLFDCRPLVEMARLNRSRLFDFSRQYADLLIKMYGERAGLHRSKCHMHVLRHSLCVFMWETTHDLSAIQDYVSHRSPASTLIYMRTDSTQKARAAVSLPFAQFGQQVA